MTSQLGEQQEGGPVSDGRFPFDNNNNRGNNGSPATGREAQGGGGMNKSFNSSVSDDSGAYMITDEDVLIKNNTGEDEDDSERKDEEEVYEDEALRAYDQALSASGSGSEGAIGLHSTNHSVRTTTTMNPKQHHYNHHDSIVEENERLKAQLTQMKNELDRLLRSQQLQQQSQRPQRYDEAGAMASSNINVRHELRRCPTEATALSGCSSTSTLAGAGAGADSGAVGGIRVESATPENTSTPATTASGTSFFQNVLMAHRRFWTVRDAGGTLSGDSSICSGPPNYDSGDEGNHNHANAIDIDVVTGLHHRRTGGSVHQAHQHHRGTVGVAALPGRQRRQQKTIRKERKVNGDGGRHHHNLRSMQHQMEDGEKVGIFRGTSDNEHNYYDEDDDPDDNHADRGYEYDNDDVESSRLIMDMSNGCTTGDEDDADEICGTNVSPLMMTTTMKDDSSASGVVAMPPPSSIAECASAVCDDDVGGGGAAAGSEPMSFWGAVRDRASWLVGLLILQSMSSFIISRNEGLLQEHLVIVQFLTMLVGAGGNAGNQASVGVIRGLAIGTVNNSNRSKFLFREIRMAVTLCTILGVTGCIRALLFMVPVLETVAITTSLMTIVFISIVLGALLPLIMLQFHVDPAHSSTTIQVVMDILGVLITVHVCSIILDHVFSSTVHAGISATSTSGRLTND